MNRPGSLWCQTARGLCLLLLVGALLAACGTPSTTTDGSGGNGATATATPVPSPSPTPTAAPSPTPTQTVPSITDLTPPPELMSMLSYLTAMGTIAKSQERLAREELGLIAVGADDATIESQMEADLPARQNLLQQLKDLTPPDEFKSMHDAMVNLTQQELDAQQQIVQGFQSGDTTLVLNSEKSIVDGQMKQIYCGAADPQQALTNMLGLPTPEPGPTPTPMTEMQPFMDYMNSIKPIITDVLNQEKTLCPFDTSTDSGKAAYYAQLKNILPALQDDVQQMAAIVPSDQFKEVHQDYVDGYQKMTKALQLSIQAYDQNDPQLKRQVCTVSAQGELKLLDAQDALEAAMVSSVSSP